MPGMQFKTSGNCFHAMAKFVAPAVAKMFSLYSKLPDVFALSASLLAAAFFLFRIVFLSEDVHLQFRNM